MVNGMKSKDLTLKEAIAKGKLPQFIKERSEQKGDKPKFDAAISSMVGKSKATQEASEKDSSEN